MSQPVFYTSMVPGFPSGNTHTAGGLIAVLDACLVNGANLTSAITLTQAGGVATTTFAGNHNFSVGDSVLVEGATPAAYNGRMKVTAKTADSVSFAVDAGTATPATGAITVKHPGAGWSKLGIDTNIAGYRSAISEGGMGHWLQVEDNNPYGDSHANARVRAAENLTSLNTADVITSVLKMDKSSYNTLNNWWVVADDRTAYFGFGLVNNPTSTPYFGPSYVFGEVTPTSATDTYAWVVSRSAEDASTAGGGIARYADNSSAGYDLMAASNLVVLRSYDGFRSGSAGSHSICGGFSSSADLGANQERFAVADPRSGAFGLAPVWLTENTSPTVAQYIARGRFRGLYHPFGKLNVFGVGAPSAVPLPYPIEVGGVSRSALCAATHPQSTPNVLSAQATSTLVFDLTGPWG